jgi:hypothetical protein
MSGIFGERVTFGQENGPDVELRVWGDEHYARYETPEGFPVVYDDQRGLFCYARVESGAYASTGTPVSEPPPAAAVRHATESAEVRQAKAAARFRLRPPPPPD